MLVRYVRRSGNMDESLSTVVMKFGGASVATPECFSNISKIVCDKRSDYDQIIVVVSAMADTTDQLITLANQVNASPPRREYDMLVSVGERISISLLAMALHKRKCEAISFTGSQSGIITCGEHSDAKIEDMQPHRLRQCLREGKVVIVAGFQGVSREKDITTLGRGGSDTSAVALAARFKGIVEFYKDVGGIYNVDPKKSDCAELYSQLTYDEALAIIEEGAEVLSRRCVQLARNNGIPLQILSPWGQVRGTEISDHRCSRPHSPVYENDLSVS